VKFAPKIAKVVEITLEKHIFKNFPDYFLVDKKRIFTPKKKHCPHYNRNSNANQQTVEYNLKTCFDNL
jgi:hypothetical protein